MSQLPKLLSFGISVAATVLTPITAHAIAFNFDQVTLFSARPIDSNDVLNFFGDVNINEGYTLVNNVDPTAPDSGHESIAQNALPGGAGYYTMGRENSPDPNTAGDRSATLQSVEGFPRFFQYLQDNNIAVNTIGFGYGQKAGFDFTQTINLGEDILGQDWLATPDSPVEERIYQAQPGESESFITLGTIPIITYSSPAYFVVDNGESPNFTDNLNIFLSDPVRAFKVDGLDPLESGLADAFLEDVAANGGFIQNVSADILMADQVQTAFIDIGDQTYDITYIGFSIGIRAVSSVPEPSSSLALMMLAGSGIVTYLKQKRKN